MTFPCAARRRARKVARRRRLGAPAAGLLALALPSLAWANGATGLNGLVTALGALVLWVIGACALVASALLGVAAWWVALREKLESSSKVFARGVLGVGACVSFGIGSTSVAGGFLLTSGAGGARHAAATATSLLAVGLTALFLAVEFVIAGLLYWRVHRRQGAPWALLLSLASFAMAGLFVLSTFLGLLLVAIAA